MKRVVTILCLAAFCMVFAGAALAQNITSGAIQGSVLDQSDKAVVGATVTITNTATGVALPPVKTGSAGDFAVAVPPGVYTIEISMTNFKTAKISNVEVIVGRTYPITQKLEVGSTTVTVDVNQGGQAVIETANTSVQNTMTGRAITNLPFVSRSAILIGVLDPGAQTVGGPRNSTFEGLPKGAINITFDGINVQDNLLKSSDGFFAINDPRIDDVQEFGITTNANDPSKSGEGAIQMSYVSKSGSNAFHGGVWEYNRNTDFDANYYYNNLAGLPRQVLDLNEFGYKVGGPILKDKLFFFTDFDFFQFPQSVLRERTLLTGTPAVGGVSGSANGFYPYIPAVGVSGTNASSTLSCTNLASGLTTASSVCTANLLGLAAATTAPNTLANQQAGTVFQSQINGTAGNPGVVFPYLAAISTVTSAPGVSTVLAPSLWQNEIAYNALTQGVRRYPDIRFDYNMTKKQSLELDYHYAWYISQPDLLNSEDPVWPVAPFNTSGGSQLSNRNLWVAAWRWAIGSNKSNELRFGFQTAPVNFGLGTPFSIYPSISALGPVPFYRFSIEGTSGPFLSPGGYQGRNTAVGQIHETFQWTRGTHQFTFGGDASGLYYNDFFTESGTVSDTSLNAHDPAVTTMFTAANLPGIGSSDLGNAEGLYASLTGRVTGWSDAVLFSPKVNGFLTGAPEVDKVRQNEFGVYGNDSWRVRPTFTFNWGLRWEYQGAPYDLYNQYSLASTTDLWGVSGTNNLFKPGVIGGVGNSYLSNGNSGIFLQNDAGQSWYPKYYRGLDPSVGFAWQPSVDWKPWKAVFGGAGRTVVRAGYSIVESREGLEGTALEISSDNPGSFGSQSATASTSVGTGLFSPGSITIPTNGSALCPSFNTACELQSPASFSTTTNLYNPNSGSGVFAYSPTLHPPRVQSWQMGIQRELGSDMALEIRYQGNHGTGLWDTYNLNEVNIFENGFLTEFNNAESNLSICTSNPAACVAAEKDLGILSQTSTATAPTSDFANLYSAATAVCAGGSPPASCATSIAAMSGQVNLPIMTAAFTGSQSGSQANSSFHSSTFLPALANQGAGSFAGTLSALLNGFLPNMVAAGYPLNFFTANPLATGGAVVLTNGAQSTYNALVVDFRRRLSHGLQFDANYAYSKSLTNYNANSAVNVNGFTTLRQNLSGYDKGPAPFDTRHAIKVQGIWDFPFGEGRKWASSSRIVNTIIGGWSFNSVTRWQTGQPVRISDGLPGGDTFNSSDPGINLAGITVQQLQSMLQLSKTQSAGAVWYVPTSLLANTGRANTAVIQPCPVAGTLCQKLFVFGPQFFEADWTLAKTTKITEHVNFEMRMEALNAFNNQNFYWACAVGTSPCSISTQSTTFGQMAGAYSDINTTQFPGGRVIQLVGRVNF
ncbi:MAG: TonB-dependent receptor [Candidatus Acidiferrales bacterium]